MTDPDTAHEIPEFELPDWGTDGAPPAPSAEPGDSSERPTAREIALEVEPERRYQSALDVKNELKDLEAESAARDLSQKATPAPGRSHPPRPPPQTQQL